MSAASVGDDRWSSQRDGNSSSNCNCNCNCNSNSCIAPRLTFDASMAAFGAPVGGATVGDDRWSSQGEGNG